MKVYKTHSLSSNTQKKSQQKRIFLNPLFPIKVFTFSLCTQHSIHLKMMRRSVTFLAAEPAKKLAPSAVTAALQTLPGWKRCPFHDALKKDYKFQDFHQAWAFMNAVVPDINKLDHHPDWSNVYNTVKVTLTTHDVGNAISDRDVALATIMETKFNEMTAKK